MPRVPEYNQRQIALATANTPYQTMKPTAEMFGSDVGRALTDLGKSLGSVADTLGDAAKYLQKKDQEKNETAAVDLFNQYTAAQGKIADSYQTLSGKLAVDGYTATEKQLSVLKRDYLARATNPAQAELLSKAMEAGSATVLGQMQRYRDQQQGVYEDDVSTTRIDQSIQGIGRFYNDSREYAKGLYLAQAESLDQLMRHQAGPEEIKAALAQVASRAMRARIDGAMAQRDSGAARNLFSLYEVNLLPDDRAATSARLGHLEFNNRVEDEVARILQASPLRLGGEQHGKTATEPSPPDAEARLAMAEKIANPQLRLAVSDRIASQNIRDQQTYLTQQRQLKSQAKDILDRGGSFTDIPYQMLIGIDAKGKAALSAYAKAGGKVKTDPVVYYGLKNLALDDPQAFLDVDLNDHLGEIDAKDLATLDQLQQSLRSGHHDPQLDLERVYKDNIDRTLRGLDLSATDIAKLYHQIDRDLAGYQAATGRKATPAEQQQLADQAVIDMKLDQRSFAMTRYGGVISTTSRTATANDNSFMIRTADHVPPSQSSPPSKEGPATREPAQRAVPTNVAPPKEKVSKSKNTAQADGPKADQAIRALEKYKAAQWPVGEYRTLTKRDAASGQGAGGFGRGRDGGTKGHWGIDIEAPVGSPVYAVSDGKVVLVDYSKSFGYQIVIEHAGGFYTQYAHLNYPFIVKGGRPHRRNKDLVKVGQVVKAGDQIAEIGRSGNAIKVKYSHLHFEVRYGSATPHLNGGTVVDPLLFLN
ncbi:MAG: M23 family metallopeptidase [Rhodospirillaceae bacterium]|nr:MAG: M23 family metallopeptidase [Rhodospirillaceae bacterium]